MSFENSFGTQEQIEHLRRKPLTAASPEKLAELLQTSYNQLYALAHNRNQNTNDRYPLNHVSVLGRLTEPAVHVNHFDFRKQRLDIASLEWDVKIARYQDEAPDSDTSELFGQWFPFIDHGHRCGYGNLRDWGYESVSQYTLKLSLFPNLMKAVQDYYDLVQAPYTRNGESERKRLYPQFTYLCGV
jgi:hypothetical protein